MTDAPLSAGLEPVAPEATGFDPDRLAEAVAYAKAHESTMDRDIGRAISTHFSEPLPDGEILGSTRPRGDPNGIVLRGRRVAAAWGPVEAPDMTFSVTKSYLAICAGLAWDDGLIPDLDAPARELVPDLFDAPQNREVTWRHLLQQTSEWEGELWGKADRIDRNRRLDTPPGAPSLKGTHRDLSPPGGFWEYNDIRVNVLAFALMRVFGRALPEVLAKRIMRPIGASDRWEWRGYRTSWVKIGGRRMQSVSGGAHWGGGMFIPTADQARTGLLMLNRGRCGDRQLLSEAWIEQCLTPCPLNRSYGFLWWLNGDGVHCPTAPRSSFFALGVGRNIIWVDPAHDLVAVVRWIERDAFDGFAERVMQALV